MLKLVTYDLHKPEKDYEKLFSALKSYSWAHPLGSVWFLNTSKTVSQIMSHLKEFIDTDDSIIIIKVNDWSAFHIDQEIINWLRSK